MKTGRILTGLALAFLLICAGVFLAARPRVLNPIWNVRLQGHLFADSLICGQKTWTTTGTADTLTIAGLDSSATVFLTPITATGTLRGSVGSNNDTVFVTSSGSETGGTDKYNYFIVWRQNY